VLLVLEMSLIYTWNSCILCCHLSKITLLFQWRGVRQFWNLHTAIYAVFLVKWPRYFRSCSSLGWWSTLMEDNVEPHRGTPRPSI